MSSLSDGSICIKANAQSCGECIQVSKICGWCTDEVSWISKAVSKLFYHMSENRELFISEESFSFLELHKVMKTIISVIVTIIK